MYSKFFLCSDDANENLLYGASAGLSDTLNLIYKIYELTFICSPLHKMGQLMIPKIILKNQEEVLNIVYKCD